MVLKNVPNGLQIAPSTAFSEIGRASGKDRRRYALYLTVFGFTAGAHLKNTGRNIVKSSSYGKRETPYLTKVYYNQRITRHSP
jgi:hypothetical protein